MGASQDVPDGAGTVEEPTPLDQFPVLGDRQFDEILPWIVAGIDGGRVLGGHRVAVPASLDPLIERRHGKGYLAVGVGLGQFILRNYQVLEVFVVGMECSQEVCPDKKGPGQVVRTEINLSGPSLLRQTWDFRRFH